MTGFIVTGFRWEPRYVWLKVMKGTMHIQAKDVRRRCQELELERAETPSVDVMPGRRTSGAQRDGEPGMQREVGFTSIHPLHV